MQDSLTLVLRSLFTRDLERLKKELSAYKVESNIWIVANDIPNSAGNLALHLVGNLRAFIGAELGGTGYIRKRDEEFSLKDIPRTELMEQIDQTIADTNHTLEQLTYETLKREYPVQVFKEAMSTEFFLVHLSAHLGYHLGQVNYHRRLLD